MDTGTANNLFSTDESRFIPFINLGFAAYLADNIYRIIRIGIGSGTDFAVLIHFGIVFILFCPAIGFVIAAAGIWLKHRWGITFSKSNYSSYAGILATWIFSAFSVMKNPHYLPEDGEIREMFLQAIKESLGIQGPLTDGALWYSIMINAVILTVVLLMLWWLHVLTKSKTSNEQV
jgi:hypothetical protein